MTLQPNFRREVRMPVDVIMPSLGFDMTEGTLARWLVKEGERVEKGQAIAEIETEKASVEIEATVSGTLGGSSSSREIPSRWAP